VLKQKHIEPSDSLTEGLLFGESLKTPTLITTNCKTTPDIRKHSELIRHLKLIQNILSLTS
jgi:hypothetical protein